jgi:drug/metabolite transporter (DMT)-like permease
MIVAFGLLLTLSLVRDGAPFPTNVPLPIWRDLALSGFVGFVIGDVLLFEAFVIIGARLAMLIYASVPALTTIGAFLWLDESVSHDALLGMAVTTAGIVLAIVSGRSSRVTHHLAHRRRAIAFAIGGSIAQSAGLLLSKRASVGLDAFAASEIRVVAGMTGFIGLALVTGRMRAILLVIGTVLRPRHMKQDPSHITKQDVAALRRACLLMTCGAILGPFLGVSLSLKSLQLLPSGVASTLMSIVPALLVPVSALVFRERVTGREILGTAAALAGVAVLSL